MSLQFRLAHNVDQYILSRNDNLVAFRRDLHADPEIARPPGFIWMGPRPNSPGRYLQNPRRDFNNAAIRHGVALWGRIAETVLSTP